MSGIEDHCGLFGQVVQNVSPEQQVSSLIRGGYGVQARGQQGAGLVRRVDGDTKIFKGKGLIKQIFTSDVLAQIISEGPADWEIIHLRYGTNGGHNVENVQPFHTVSLDGHAITVAHNGEFVATEKIRRKLKQKTPDEASDTYLLTQLLTQASGTPEEKLLSTLDVVDGSYCLLIGIDDSLYVARDPKGIKPLVLGRTGDGWMVASETHALDKVGALTVREVNPGEVLRLTKDGPIVIREGTQGEGNMCDFEWAYIARPESRMPMYNSAEDGMHPERWRNIMMARMRCGEILIEEGGVPDVDMVVGIPDSGNPFAAGCAKASSAPFIPGVIRDHYDEDGDKRLFQGDDEKAKIRKKILGKLSFAQSGELWKGKRVLFADDSQVRGDLSTEITEMAFAMGAIEVHWAFGYPMPRHTCHLGTSLRTEAELIAARNDGDPVRIAQEIGANSVHYISYEGFIRSRRPNAVIRRPQDPSRIFLENGGCGGCITGRYPVDKDGSHRSLEN